MSSIYFIGIGGTAMASTAVALSHAGHAITGSDTQLYPPMSTYLEEHNIRYFNGFSEHNLQSASPDIIVVGNAISRGNPELEYALEHRLELVSMPDLVRRTLIGGNTSIVVTGTHGKTTTTSLVAWLLEHGGIKPGFLVGGIPENFSVGCRASGRETEGFFISEGDEYDTAFFDKRSKFLHYRPDIAIINNIEFDHADIFSSLEEIRKSFRLFVNLIPRNGVLIVNGEDPTALEAASKAFCRVERFGLSGECEWQAINITADHDGSSFDILHCGKLEGNVKVPLFGNYNIMNTLAAIAAAMAAGLSFEAVSRGLPFFRRPKRRMEVIGTFGRGITLVEDFAHHPTAVRVTLEAIAALYEGRRIVTCFEPRSNTTTRNIFQKELSECFSPSSVVAFGKVHRPERYNPDERLDTDRLKNELENQGKKVFISTQENRDYPMDIVGFIEKNLEVGDVVVMLSNGSFANLKNLLIESFKKYS
ncbi:MAG: UDP-N-acetylmuramate:L-alanyl-gamma-D-glutamyl-meso-diaminopimelate ligase [Chlorobiaceae bacterium]|nr:UDP-N-acetylmuramate:L-alanyl-gamma-D-glutamyl-meso-diaminopimelate ligase [Chlorobiaceae bacterium]